MRDLTERERTALDAVAKTFSAAWEKAGDPSHAYLTTVGKRVDLDLTTLTTRRKTQGEAAPPRLRFDKVAARLVEGLKSTLSETVPPGTTVLLTVTAPIRLPSQTAASLEKKIQTLLERGSPRQDEKETVHGNPAQIRVLTGQSARAPKLIGFVHNSDSDPLLLLNTTQELLELISPPARIPELAKGRWLLIISDEADSFLKTYRAIYTQLHPATSFERVVLVFNDKRVEILTDKTTLPSEEMN